MYRYRIIVLEYLWELLLDLFLVLVRQNYLLPQPDFVGLLNACAYFTRDTLFHKLYHNIMK